MMNNLEATNISAVAAGRITYLPTNAALISINEPNSPLIPLKIDRQLSGVLTLSFWDINGKLFDGKNTYLPIDEKQISEIIKFCFLHKDKNFIVHCRAGISRSSAICLYLHLKYGHKLKDDFWRYSKPNRYVLGGLLSTHIQLEQYGPTGLSEY